jgi:hypothetical protein
MRAEIEGRFKSDSVRHSILCSRTGISLGAHEIKGGTVNTYPIESSFSVTYVGP